MKKRHPRWGELNSIESAELLKMVWTIDPKKVANEFGISMADISRRCVDLGFGKSPTVTEWKLVQSGKILVKDLDQILNENK
mgnify:CR=1 FL=1